LCLVDSGAARRLLVHRNRRAGLGQLLFGSLHVLLLCRHLLPVSQQRGCTSLSRGGEGGTC
jgi:hypothetical protein